MRKIVYYVATSIDGYISGPNDDISGFTQEGNGVAKYLADLKNYDTVLMGRKTYEFGYLFGLLPGQAPYPHMKHYIFSKSLKFEKAAENVKVYDLNLELIKSLKEEAGTDIYLCGGGQLANWFLEHELIEELKIKLNPFIQGKGIKLFGETNKAYQLELVEQEQFEHGLQIISYKIKYD